MKNETETVVKQKVKRAKRVKYLLKISCIDCGNKSGYTKQDIFDKIPVKREDGFYKCELCDGQSTYRDFENVANVTKKQKQEFVKKDKLIIEKIKIDGFKRMRNDVDYFINIKGEIINILGKKITSMIRNKESNFYLYNNKKSRAYYLAKFFNVCEKCEKVKREITSTNNICNCCRSAKEKKLQEYRRNYYMKKRKLKS